MGPSFGGVVMAIILFLLLRRRKRRGSKTHPHHGDGGDDEGLPEVAEAQDTAHEADGTGVLEKVSELPSPIAELGAAIPRVIRVEDP